MRDARFIVFNLKREWYLRISSGEKTVEYRRICRHWSSRLRDAVFSAGFTPFYAVFRLGYSRDYPDIVRAITKVDIGACPYDGWDGLYYRVFFGRDNVNSST